MSRARDLARLGNTSALAVDTSFNVGIGSLTPDVKLDVIGDAEISGVITATSFSGSGSGLTGVASTDNINTNNIAISGIATVGTSITMRDGAINVTGVITASNGFSGDLTGDVTGDLTGNADTFTVTANNSTDETVYPIFVDGATGSQGAESDTGLTYNPSTGDLAVGGNVSVGGTLTYEDVTNVDSVGLITARSGVNISGGEFKVGTAVTVGAAGISTFSNGVNLAPGTGLLREKVSSTATAWNSSGDLNLDNGMVQYTSGNLGGTNNTLNITSSVGINTQMAVGEMIIVTGITSCNSTSSYVNALKIDHTTVQVAWVGGSAPSDGGGSGFDTYTFNIWKTASATYNVIGNQVKTS